MKDKRMPRGLVVSLAAVAGTAWTGPVSMPFVKSGKVKGLGVTSLHGQACAWLIPIPAL